MVIEDLYNDNSEQYYKLLHKASYYQTEGLLTESLNILNQAISIFPTNLEAILLRAKLYILQGDNLLAEKDLQEILFLHPNHLEAYFIFIQLKLDQDNLDAAKYYLNIAKSFKAPDYRIYELEAKLFFAQGDSQTALKKYSKALNLCPENRDLRYSYAHLLNLTCNYSKALTVLEDIFLNHPNHLPALLLKADILFCQKEYLSALTSYNAYLKIYPAGLDGYIGRGATFLQLNRLDEALADLFKAEERSPLNIKVKLSLGEALWRCGKLNESLNAYEEAINLGANEASVFIGKAEVLLDAGRYSEAIADCDKALELDPDNPDILAARGALYLNIDCYNAALADLNRAIALDPELVEAIITRAELREKQNDFSSAAADYAAALRLSPDNPELISLWLRAVSKETTPEATLKLLAKELNKFPTDTKLLLLKADLLAEINNEPEAIKCYATVANLDTQEVEPFLRLAEFYEKCSRWQDALSSYEKALQRNPNDPLAYLMRAALLEKIGRTYEAAKDRELASDLRRLRN